MSNTVLLFFSPDTKIELEPSLPVPSIRVSGTINENSDLTIMTWVVNKLRNKVERLNFELSHLTHITTFGIENWVKSAKQLSLIAPSSYHQVRENFLDHWNAKMDFFSFGALSKGIRLESVEAPYFCSSCQKERMSLIRTDDLKQNGDHTIAPTVSCEQCKVPMRFSWIESEYFRFLRKHPSC